jgi:hypothetical protein
MISESTVTLLIPVGEKVVLTSPVLGAVYTKFILSPTLRIRLVTS